MELGNKVNDDGDSNLDDNGVNLFGDNNVDIFGFDNINQDINNKQWVKQEEDGKGAAAEGPD